ncbi:uncharacterized protein LOC129243675 [Anastrepha obliqua]|uniref:uncharacterized protein LOC129243675 n=1 Tax=Anastrepha obliqua TaxID=95512 RepID=UPI002409493A|nr:uncharacterized protein LOC129243675 [Anastrepha obliqua]
MSKPQTKTAQLRNGLKTTTGATSKKSAVGNPTKTTSGSTKTNTQIRTTPSAASTVTNRTLEEKPKLKISTQARKAEPEVATKTRTQRDVTKPKNTPPTKTLTTSRAVPKITSRINVPSTKKRIAATTVKSSVNEQPMRAKHNLDIADTVKKRQSTAIKPNAVLDTFHNVTVASPPPRRKEITTEPINESIVPIENDEQPKRVRTHSLKDEEIIVLRTDSAKQRIEQEILADGATSFITIGQEPVTPEIVVDEVIRQKSIVKDPVAFEVAFGEPLKSKSRAKSREASETRIAENRNDMQSGDGLKDTITDSYSDDFESYESDFETGSSTQNGSIGNTESGSSTHSEDEDNSKSILSLSSEEENTKSREEIHINNSDDEEESELTQYPVTVIQRDKEFERKLDSGNYEMNSRKHLKLSEITTQTNERYFDSMDTSYSVASTDQLDSGISGYTINNSNTQAEVDKFGGIVCSYGGYADFNTRPIRSKRGTELMTKIRFDTLTFSLFDLKPISYDIYMQTYGTLNTTQCSTQTNDNRMSTECQTDNYDRRTMWTQHPPKYDLQTIQKLGAGLNGTMAIQNCCGESPMEEGNAVHVLNADIYDDSLQQLSVFRQSIKNRVVGEQLKSLHKPVDFERLNSFLLRSSSVISKVLNSVQPDTRQQERLTKLGLNQSSLQAISKGYIRLDTKFLNALHVVRVFANARHDVIITVHASRPDAEVYRSDFSNLLMVWSTSECSQPMRLLSTWSEVCRAEICYDCPDIVVCGLHDGSIAMWDLRETYSFCSKLDGYLTHFAATQSVVPRWCASSNQPHRIIDLGAVVDIRSFRTPPKAVALGTYRSIQFAALNDTGIMSIWTLVEMSVKHCEFDTPKTSNTQHRRKCSSSPVSNSRFEYSSPWARVKLIQSAICDLRDYLESGLRRTQTQFQTTKSLFEKEIYSDEVLRELNETKMALNQSQPLQGLRFTSIDTGSERIYVCTNRNFVLTCSKSLKSERFSKININEGGFLFPTALKVLTNDNFLAVGLSNGSVMIVNCNQQALAHQRNGDARLLETTISCEDVNHVIKTPHTPDIDPDTGKSCAIQNIILNERRLLGNGGNPYTPEYDTRPSTAACIALISNQKRPFELRVYDRQLIISGSALRKDLVQSLEISSDGWRLFALVNGQLRAYDFYLDREIVDERMSEKEKRIVDIAVAKSSQNENHLITLDQENDVEVHLLKQ